MPPAALFSTTRQVGSAALPPLGLDTGLMCLLILARFYDLPADGSQLHHLFVSSGKNFSDIELLRAAKHL